MNKPFDSVHDAPEKSPGFLLWHISTTWRRSIEIALTTFGLTHPQFVVLATLGWLSRNSDQVTQIAIGTMAGLDPNTNSQIIKGLEKKGLITRARSHDGRAKHVLLTPQGYALLQRALPAVEQTDAQFFSALKEKELSALLDIFQKINS